MLSHKNKYILYLVLINGLLAILLSVFGKIIFEDIRPILGIAVAITMFFLYELFAIFIMEKKSKVLPPRKLVNLFYGLKVGKIILSLVFLTVYAFTVKIEFKPFLGAFIILYFIFLLFDTLYLLGREKTYKMKQVKE